MDFLLPQLGNIDKRKIIIYGTGEVASQYFDQVKRIHGDHKVAFFMESKPLKEEFLGKRVYGPGRLDSISKNDYVYLITSYSSVAEISNLLKGKGIVDDHIIMPNEFESNFYLKKGIGTIKNVCFYPEITDYQKYKDICTRIEWYLPVNEYCKPEINLFTALETKVDHLKQRIINPDKISEYCDLCDMILVWDKRSLYDDIIRHNKTKVYCVDPGYYSIIESKTYSELLYFTFNSDTQEKLSSLFIHNYEKMLDENKGKTKSTLFCTGPSIEKAFDFNYDGHFKVICNSIVKNGSLLEYIHPDLLMFADPVFHFSPCEYSRKFREDAVAVIEKYGCYCIVPELVAPLIITHYPQVKEKLIGVPILNSVDFNFPSPDSFHTRLSSNILTLFMIPVASRLTNHIYMIGCDGRQKSETYFWKHNNTTQYSDLMSTVFDMHESFFRDREYRDYYDEHCEYLNQQLQYGESKGKRYYSLAESFIPALRDRTVI